MEFVAAFHNTKATWVLGTLKFKGGELK